MAPTTLVKNNHDFDPKKFFATIGEGKHRASLHFWTYFMPSSPSYCRITP
jgi:hypothetical protein